MKSFIVSILACVVMLSASPAVLAGGVIPAGGVINSGEFKTLDNAKSAVTNPLKGVDNLQQFVGLIIKNLLGVIGSIALVIFIYAGYTMLMAQGNPKEVDKAKNTMIWASLGLVLIFSSYALVKFVIEQAGG